jgi:fructose 1,6-bisphosphate aldolase/phosphatase
MANLITLSVIKADVGGYVGHSTVHPRLLDAAPASESAKRSRESF